MRCTSQTEITEIGFDPKNDHKNVPRTYYVHFIVFYGVLRTLVHYQKHNFQHFFSDSIRFTSTCIVTLSFSFLCCWVVDARIYEQKNCICALRANFGTHGDPFVCRWTLCTLQPHVTTSLASWKRCMSVFAWLSDIPASDSDCNNMKCKSEPL